LSTYTVDNQLIWNIADFVQNRLPQIVHFDEPAPPALPSGPGQSATPKLAPGRSFYDELTLAVYGSDNTMFYKPISKYTQSTFNNDIQVLSIELAYKEAGRSEDARAISIVIRFGHTSEDSELSIALQDNAPKEKVKIIEDALLRLLEPNKNKNGVAYPNDFVPTLIFVIGFIIGLGGLMFDNAFVRSFCVIVFGTAIIFVAHRFLKGYCTFDSIYQRRLNVVLNWITGAVALFVIAVVIRSLLSLR